MSDSMIIERVVPFNASPKQVWDLLTLPELTKQYMYGCEVLSDWEVGSSIRWKGLTEEGKEIIHVKGEITDIVIGERVSFTIFDPNVGLQDIPENYITLTYNLKVMPEGVELTILQSDLKGKENAEARYQESIAGWDMIIPVMQKMLK